MTTKTTLTIVIVSWNTRDLLLQCVQSLHAHPPSCAWKIIVVDNASTDGSAEAIKKQFSNVEVIENSSNVGFAAANNQGIQKTEDEFVLLLNPDTKIQPDSLNKLLQELKIHPKVGLIAPRLINPDGSFQASYAKFPTLVSDFLLMTGLARWFIGRHAPSPTPTTNEQPRPVDWVAGAAMLARSEAIEQVGLLDEKYFMYSEETDWCWRFWRKGWEVWYTPEVSIVHFGGASSSQRSIESYVWLYASKVQFYVNAYGHKAAKNLQRMFVFLANVRLVWWALLEVIASAERKQRAKHRAKQDRALLQLDWSSILK